MDPSLPDLTESERACRDALRGASGDSYGPIERHSERVYELALLLAADREVDRELLRCAALLHDIGLYPSVASREAYVTDGRILAERLLAGWEPGRLRRCGDAIERHHELRSQASLGLEVELIRVADRIEVSQGLVRAGMPRARIRALRREIPVRGFVPEVVRGLARAARERPRSLPRIFFPKGR